MIATSARVPHEDVAHLADTNAALAVWVESVCKTYRIYDRPQDRLKQMLARGRRRYFREFEALRDVSLKVPRGQTLGIVGRNGSGKSTLLQMICGTLSPSSGSVQVQGRISALLELGAGFNPEFTGRENVFLNAAILGLSDEETRERYAQIVAFSGLDTHHLAQPVKTYSSGMYVRLAFAVAVAVQPDILVVDEALAVGDEAFQRKCFARLRELQEGGATILFVSHAAQTVIELCDRAVLIDDGELLCDGDAKEVIEAYHRLIFSPQEKRSAIRQQIVQGLLPHTAGQQEAATEGDVRHDPSMRSESRSEYQPSGGQISQERLTDLAGVPVNLLQAGERYCFRYRIAFDALADAPKFGMLIKTKRGIHLGGAVATALADGNVQMQAGQAVDVCFMFDCPLRPGSYFLNCGVTRRIEGEDVFVHRILDALQFKVIDARARAGIDPAGVLDIGAEALLDIVDAV